MNEIFTAILKTSVIIAVIAATPLLCIFLRIFCKRLTLRSRLAHKCKSLGAELVPTHRLWMFGQNGGAHCDFFIVGKRTVYAVKLFSVRRYHTELHFTDDGKYFIRSFVAFAAGMLSKTPVDSKRKAFAAVDFRQGSRQEWYMKKFTPVLLVNPMPYEIRYDTHDESRILGAGEVVGNMHIFSLSRFLGELDADSERI